MPRSGRDARTKYLRVRLTPQEYADLKARADAAGARLSAYVRALIHIEIRTVDAPGEDADYVLLDDKTARGLERQIRHWGYHLDHALHALNLIASKGFMNQKDTYETMTKAISYIAEVEEAQGALQRDIKELVRKRSIRLETRDERAAADEGAGGGA